MRRLWNYNATMSINKSFRRKILNWMQNDLTWWHRLLFQYNEMLFFNEIKSVKRLYTNACLIDLKNFVVHENVAWILQSINQNMAFRAQLLDTSFSINVHEMKTILLNFQTWRHFWIKRRIKIFIDNVTIYSKFFISIFKSSANFSLRKTLLIAIKWNIIIEYHWIKKIVNGLIDVLSRFDNEKIVDMCFHWQISLNSMNFFFIYQSSSNRA